MNTSNVDNIALLFYECVNLTRVNFQNFDATSLTIFNSMFINCKKLKYIDFRNAVDNPSFEYDFIFYGIEFVLITCINETKAPKLYSEIIKINSLSKNCSYIPCQFLHYYEDNGIIRCTITDECPKEYNKFILEKNECTDDCSKDNNSNMNLEKNALKIVLLNHII